MICSDCAPSPRSALCQLCETAQRAAPYPHISEKRHFPPKDPVQHHPEPVAYNDSAMTKTSSTTAAGTQTESKLPMANRAQQVIAIGTLLAIALHLLLRFA